MSPDAFNALILIVDSALNCINETSSYGEWGLCKAIRAPGGCAVQPHRGCAAHRRPHRQTVRSLSASGLDATSQPRVIHLAGAGPRVDGCRFGGGLAQQPISPSEPTIPINGSHPFSQGNHFLSRGAGHRRTPASRSTPYNGRVRWRFGTPAEVLPRWPDGPRCGHRGRSRQARASRTNGLWPRRHGSGSFNAMMDSDSLPAEPLSFGEAAAEDEARAGRVEDAAAVPSGPGIAAAGMAGPPAGARYTSGGCAQTVPCAPSAQCPPRAPTWPGGSRVDARRGRSASPPYPSAARSRVRGSG